MDQGLCLTEPPSNDATLPLSEELLLLPVLNSNPLSLEYLDGNGLLGGIPLLLVLFDSDVKAAVLSLIMEDTVMLLAVEVVMLEEMLLQVELEVRL